MRAFFAFFGLLSGMLLALSCGKGATAPEAPLRAGQGGLGLKPEPGGSIAQGPVQVSYFAPAGEALPRAEIALTFDRPMVELSRSAADGVLELTPQVEGKARWLGSQTLLFEPARPLPMGTEFEVKLSPTLTALDGQRLAQPFGYRFATPPLTVLEVSPGDESEGELEARAFELVFNAPVELSALEKELRVSVTTADGAARTAAVELSYAEDKSKQRVRVKPTKPYPLAARVQLELGEALRGTEGPRPLGSTFKSSFRVHEAFALASTRPCDDQGGRCSPGNGVSIRFTTPVSVKKVLAALKVSPELPAREPPSDDWESEWVYVPGDFAPLATYQLKLEGPLTDAYGNALKGPRELTVRTGPYDPFAYFPVDGDLMMAGGSEKLPLRVRNMAKVKVALSRVSPDELEPLATGRVDRTKSKVTTLALAGAGPKERRMLEVDLAPVLTQGKGVVLGRVLRKDQDGHEHMVSRTLLAFTDLAPSLKLGNAQGVVWVTSLSTAAQVAEADVRLVDCGETVGKGRTDARGMYRFKLDKPASCELFAIVSKGGDVSFAHQYAGVSPYELNSGGSTVDGPVEAVVFTERGVYRPGETLRLKGILRTRSERGMEPTLGKVAMRVADSQDREIERADVTLSELGTFSRVVRIPGSTALGPLSVSLEHQGQTFYESVQVAEFRRAEIEAEARTERQAYVRGESANLTVRGSYLFGAPLANQRAFVSVRRMERDIRPEGEKYDGFVFDDQTRWLEDVVPPSDTELSGLEGKLDGRGELRERIPLKLDLTSGAAAVELEATVEGLGGVSTSARTEVLVTPAAFLVGIKPNTALAEAGKPVTVSLTAAKLSGEAVGKAPLELSVVRRVYESKVAVGDAGERTSEWTHRDEAVGSCRVESRAQPVSCDITPSAPGLHLLRVNAQDDKGRKVSAALSLYVYGPGAASWGESTGPVITLKSDRARYKLGDKAKVLVASPFASAEALVTVEREGVISAETMHLTGQAATLEIPIDQRFVPNAFVTVLLIRPKGQVQGSDEGRPEFRVGSVMLQADVSDRHLSVKVQPDAAEKQPGEEMRVRFDVVDGKKRPTKAELTVFAVDEGVLSLTGYRTPDPFARMYAPVGLSVWTVDARGRLARDAVGEDDKGGEEGGGGGMGARRDFDAVAYYAPEVVTDAQGHAEVSFKLPESLTRFRIMAVAVSREGLGSGEAAVRTRQPLMLRAMLPRVFRAGDRASAGAVVHNDSARDLEVEVQAAVEGASIVGDAQRKVRVPKGQGVEVRFGLDTARVGTAKLSFAARADKFRDALETERKVLAPNLLETVSTSSVSEPRAAEALGALPGVRDDLGGLEVKLATSALGDLETPALALADYPYGCTEQLSSRLVGLAALERLQKRGLVGKADYQARAQAVLSELERHQRGDGSFGLWSSEDPMSYPPLDAFLTGYAVVSIQAASRAGLVSSPHVLERAKGFLLGYLRGDRDPLSQKLAGTDLAFVVLALSELGTFDQSYAHTLFERRASLTLLSKVELARAYPQGAREREVLFDELKSAMRITADEAHLEENVAGAGELLMASTVRASAEALLLWLSVDASHALVPKLARWLSASRELDGSWGSTQESAWGLTALATYLDRVEGEPSDMVARAFVNDRELGSAALEGPKASASFSLPMRELARDGARVTVAKEGKGKLYYTLRLRYARGELPRESIERGFAIEREYECISAAELARGDTKGTRCSSVKAGDYVRVILRVAVPATRRFVLIEDPLPAGLETLNFALVTSPQAASQALGFELSPVDHTQLFDDRAVFAVTQLEPGLHRYGYLTRATTTGSFVVPPSRVEEMYHPETFARTAARTMEVSEQ